MFLSAYGQQRAQTPARRSGQGAAERKPSPAWTKAAAGHLRAANRPNAGIGKGDVVVTHGSERLMYVYEVIEQRSSVGYVCVWFDAGRLKEAVFGGQALRRASSL